MSAKAELDPDLLRILDHALARLVPSDELGPGAREAGALHYVVSTLREHEPALRATYADGLARLDTLARAIHGSAFTDLDAAAQDRALKELESEPVTLDAGSTAFFDILLRHAREGMFCDPRWGGNVERCGWRLLGYDGPRAVWTAEAQAVEAAP
ncbi:MAG: gluconate 2-dehydrogenase subunit 3 family protein [Gaiellales bacterium]